MNASTPFMRTGNAISSLMLQITLNCRENKGINFSATSDYAHRNIIMGDDKVHIINFDYCCYELRVYDVANLIRRKMRKCNWDIKKAISILDKYCSVEPLSKDDFVVLKIILQFPQKFWRVANRYYNSRRSWSERSFMARLREVTGEMDYHKKFIRNFSQVY